MSFFVFVFVAPTVGFFMFFCCNAQVPAPTTKEELIAMLDAGTMPAFVRVFFSPFFFSFQLVQHVQLFLMNLFLLLFFVLFFVCVYKCVSFFFFLLFLWLFGGLEKHTLTYSHRHPLHTHTNTHTHIHTYTHTPQVPANTPCAYGFLSSEQHATIIFGKICGAALPSGRLCSHKVKCTQHPVRS